MRQEKGGEQGKGGKMLELEQVRGAETRNVPSTSRVGAAGLETGTEVLSWGHGKGHLE